MEDKTFAGGVKDYLLRRVYKRMSQEP